MNREQINNLINTCQQEIRRLQEENKQLKEQLQQKETIINKAREEVRYLESNCDISNIHAQKLKQILDNKGDE